MLVARPRHLAAKESEMRTSGTIARWAIGFSLLLPLLAGCAGLSYCREEVALRGVIHHALQRERLPSLPPKYRQHFKNGWKQAYYNISKGADPCPPSTPPEQYWTTKFQNVDGGRKISAWFAGYQRGVEAAQRDCRHVYSKVPLGPYCERPSAHWCEPPTVRNTFPHEEVIEMIGIDQLGDTPSDTGVELSSFEAGPTINAGPTIVHLPSVHQE